MFAVGDYIIYGNHGVCRVEKIGTVSLSMADKNKVYYTLRPVYKSEAVVYAPVENPKSNGELAFVLKMERSEMGDYLTERLSSQ